VPAREARGFAQSDVVEAVETLIRENGAPLRGFAVDSLDSDQSTNVSGFASDHIVAWVVTAG